MADKSVKVVENLDDGTKGSYIRTEVSTGSGVTLKITNVVDEAGNTYDGLTSLYAAHKSAEKKRQDSIVQRVQQTGGVYVQQEKNIQTTVVKDAQKESLPTSKTDSSIPKSDDEKKEDAQNNPKSVVDPTANNKSSVDEKKEQENTEAKEQEEANAARPKEGVDTNVFYIDVKVFLEGVQVPHASAAVSYGIGNPPTCSIVIPAAGLIRGLPETTKILIIYRDLLPDPDTHEYEYRVLFDGELSGMSYNVSSNGAQLSLSGVHSAAYLTYMQLLNQAATEYIYNRAPSLIGDLVTVNVQGSTKQDITIIQDIIENNKDTVQGAADIVYLILKHLLEGFKAASPVSQWYWEKLGNDTGGYKIMQRIYGVSEGAKSAPLLPLDIEGGMLRPKNGTGSQARGATGRVYGPGTPVASGTAKLSNPNDIAKEAVTAAEKVESLSGIPADIIYAHWCHESGNFSSRLAREDFNLGGLTTTQDQGYPENKHGNVWFKHYNSVPEYADHFYNGFLNLYRKPENGGWELEKIKDTETYTRMLYANKYCPDGTTEAQYKSCIDAHRGKYADVKNQMGYEGSYGLDLGADAEVK